MNKELFSEEALERLRSPEQLNKMLTVVDPASWMAVAVLLLFIGSVGLWSVFGTLAVTVSGVGVIMDTGGVARVVHTSSGRIEKIRVEPGDRVKKGDIIGLLDVPELRGDLVASRQRLSMSSNLHEVVDSLAAFDRADVQMDRHRYIVSPCDGVVAEMHAREGDILAAGADSICTIRVDYDRRDMAVVMYVPAGEGKKVRPGMTVQIEPGGADSSQSGKVMGVVREVGLYPVSAPGMRYVLGNSELATAILQANRGAAAEVRIELIRDAGSPSGYLWTSVIGVPPAITPGEMCSGSIIVERKPPIEKAFLKLGQWLRFT